MIVLLTKTTFDEHRASCESCNRSPYTLCAVGGNLLCAEVAAAPRDPGMLRPWTQKQIAARVFTLLQTPCPKCGAKLVWKNSDVICPRIHEAGVSHVEAAQHAYFPIDTGPFSLGRRVD